MDETESEPKRGGDELKSHILALVQLLAIRTTSAATARLKSELGIGSMSFRVMSVLAVEPDASGVRVAEVVGRDEAAVSRCVKGLLQQELVRETAGPGRARRLRLTAAGAEVQARAWSIARERERQLVSVLPEGEQEALRATLQRLLRRAQDLGAA